MMENGPIFCMGVSRSIFIVGFLPKELGLANSRLAMVLPPDDYQTTVTGRGNELAIGAETHAIHLLDVPAEGGNILDLGVLALSLLFNAPNL